MRLDIEKENMKSLTSPIRKPTTAFKQISPEDKTALNILDGANPNKTKRIRPKTRRFIFIITEEDKFYLTILYYIITDHLEYEIIMMNQL